MQAAFLIPVNRSLKCILFDDVLFINAKDKYCEIVTTNKKKWLTRVPISYLQEKLPEDLFIRVHRTFIVSISKIEWLHPTMLEIAGFKISVSKEGYRAISQRILIVCPETDKKTKKGFETFMTEKIVNTFGSKEMAKVI